MSSSPQPQDPSQSAVGAAAEYPVVAEEEALLERNLEALQQLPPEARLDSDAIVAEMNRLRDEIPTAQTDERPGLMDQYERLGNLLLQQGASLSGEGVDPSSPYFAHMRLRQDGREREVFLGKATRLDNGLRIVDWRHAPISALFYRYARYLSRVNITSVIGPVLIRLTQVGTVSDPPPWEVADTNPWRTLHVDITEISTFPIELSRVQRDVPRRGELHLVPEPVALA
jgi:DNA helicase-2/ATP-dependent DNA helicase PcrA